MDLVLAGSVDPIRKRRGGLLACGYFASATAGGAILGALLGAMAYTAKDQNMVGLLRVVLTMAFIGSIAQLVIPKIPILELRRQVSRQPLAEAGQVKLTTICGYGLQIGSVICTFIRFPAFYVAALALVLTQSPKAAFVGGVLIGGIRGASPIIHRVLRQRAPQTLVRSVSCRMNTAWDVWAVRVLAVSTTVLFFATFSSGQSHTSFSVQPTSDSRGGEQ